MVASHALFIVTAIEDFDISVVTVYVDKEGHILPICWEETTSDSVCIASWGFAGGVNECYPTAVSCSFIVL